MTAPTTPLLTVDRLTKLFPVRAGVFGRIQAWVHAVEDVSFTVAPGETLGLVGESGCGKTTLGRCVLRLIQPTSGAVEFDGHDILRSTAGDLRRRRRDMQIIFQDPFASLDPRMTVERIVGEALRIHKLASGGELRNRVNELLDIVGLDPRHARRYPHEFSGGQRQRIGIARALAVQPKLIVADEPVSALDVSIQAQILNLLGDIQDRYRISFLFIAHNLAVVRHFSHRVAVMYLGKIVEIADSETLYQEPLHPYTRALFEAVPAPEPSASKRLRVLSGDVPSPIHPPSGCRFHPRCPIADDRICPIKEPVLTDKRPRHWVACHLA